MRPAPKVVRHSKNGVCCFTRVSVRKGLFPKMGVARNHPYYFRIFMDIQLQTIQLLGRPNDFGPHKESKKDFALSVGMLMAYLQAESFSNSGRYFATWPESWRWFAQTS